MPQNILEGLSNDLADEVDRATDDGRKAVALAACRTAVDRTGLNVSLIESALHHLEKGLHKDQKLVAALERLVEDLDDKYFDAQKRYEAGDGQEKAYRTLFAKARAANAVLFAFSDDPFVAATHSIYEACAAIGTDEVRSAVRQVLRRRTTRG